VKQAQIPAEEERACTPLPAGYVDLMASAPGSILLQTTRYDADNYRSYLFLDPLRILSDLSTFFEDVEAALAAGQYVAGYLTYESGVALQSLTSRHPQPGELPALWFGVYGEPFVFDHRTGEFEGLSPEIIPVNGQESIESCAINDLRFGMSPTAYAEKIFQIQEYIRSGDAYQVNFTDRFEFELSGTAAALFESLNRRQPTAYSAFVHGGGWQILSHSPELFFRRKYREIVTEPMKGTAPRGLDASDDKRQADWLRSDIKNRSENLMIVDLMRNDLGRICEFGSVHVENLFHVERFETLLQMTSTVSGRLREGIAYREIFASLFPSGSITGAPKLRTMEIIDELESAPRGVYTGAIGFISPRQEAVFNVPIRTLILKGNRGMIGVGSGIVIDSDAEAEYAECVLKSNFLSHSEEPFELFESILWDGSFPLLALHLDRLESSAYYFSFSFDRVQVRRAIEDAAAGLPANMRFKVRAALNRSGHLNIASTLVEDGPMQGTVSIADERVSSRELFLRHKTTRRTLYDESYRNATQAGHAEWLFFNERGELTEGCISNVFVEKAGRWFTPPIECGLLPGVYRRHLLETKSEASEKTMTIDDLVSADAIYICNAVRGCRKVTLG